VVATLKELLQSQLKVVEPNEYMLKLACVWFFTAIFDEVGKDLASYDGKIKPLEWHSRLEEIRQEERVREKIYNAACKSLKGVRSSHLYHC